MARRPDPTRPDFIVGDSIADILAEAGIRPSRDMPGPGQTIRMMCPACDGGRAKARTVSVTVDAHGDGVVWQCHRGTCPGCRGNGRIDRGERKRGVFDDPPPPPTRAEKVIVPPKPHAPDEQVRDAALYEFFAARGIGQETVDAFGIYATTKRWQGKGDQWLTKPTFVFPYLLRGELVSRKFRSIDKEFVQDKDSLRSLFNVDAIESPDEAIFVEGEMDVLAMWEAGFRQVVSLPDGAPPRLYAEDDPRRKEEKRFAALDTCGHALVDVQRIILATDADVPGDNLAEELARRLGPERCARVAWPAGCKDANEVLQQHGAGALQACIAAAAPIPLKGLWTPKPGALRDFLTAGRMPTGLQCGIRALDEIARLPDGGGWLITVTGVPQHGKGTLLRCWLPFLAAKHDMHIVWFSPEDGRAETLALDVLQVRAKQPLREAGTYMPEDVFADAEAWVARHVTFIVADDPNTDPTLEWMLGRADAAIRRTGGRFKRVLLVVDPWNEVDFTLARGQSEHQFTGQWLRRLKAWGRARGAGVLIAAHPTKLAKEPKSGKYPVADGYDISGCYAADTDVLTRRGWVPHAEVTEQDEIACFDLKTQAIRYERPLQAHAYEHDGEMHHYTGYGLDLLVTPDHRMVVQPAWSVPGRTQDRNRRGRPHVWKRDGWEFGRSVDLQHAKYRMPIAAALDEAGSEFPIPSTLDQSAAWSFVGWFVSEGWWSQRAPAVCQVEANHGRVREVLLRLGIPFSEAVDQPRRANEQPMWRARIRRRAAPAFCDWLEKRCGSGAAHKRLPPEAFRLPRNLKAVLFNALIAGDGHLRANGSCAYSTASAGLADDVQRLAVELGRHAQVAFRKGAEKHHHGVYRVEIGRADRQQRCVLIPRNRTSVPYRGSVYCLTVPTGAYVTRRNGVMAICGNSSNWFNKTDLGVTVYRDREGEMQVHAWKAKFRDFGRNKGVARLGLDKRTGLLRSLGIEDETTTDGGSP